MARRVRLLRQAKAAVGGRVAAAERLMGDSPLGPAPSGVNAPRGADGPGLFAPGAPTNALSSERYLAWLYSPQEQQPVLSALCQIEAEVAASLRQGIEHHVAHA